MTLRILGSFVTTVAVAVLSFSAGAVTVMIDYVEVEDAPAGFHDSPNQAARREAFERALEIWTSQLAGDVTLDARVFYQDDEFFLGGKDIHASAKPTSASANLGPLPFSATFYPAALASQLTGNSHPATTGDAVGSHMQVIFNDEFHMGSPGTPIWWYEFENPTGPGNISFLTIALHELGHAFGMFPLVQTSTTSINPGAWVNLLIEPIPTEPTTLPFGDIYSRFLTRTPVGGGVNDEDFFDMNNAERFAAATSGEVYFTGANVKAAAEFTPPPAAPLTSFKGEIQILASSPFTQGSLLGHWDNDHIVDLVLKPETPPGFELHDIDATRELMQDLGWTLLSPPVSGAVAWVDFGFPGEEYGTEVLPFNTFGEAVDFVTSGGTINIKPGTSGESLTVNKAMTVNAVGGTATIGQP